MTDRTNRPIFVVGSPRSGTSVLTWCLGQHPNIIALEESGWMGDLAIDLAIYYQIGTKRSDYSLLSSMDVKEEEFFSTFGKSINDIILRHRGELSKKQWQRMAGAEAVMGPETQAKLAADAKKRWVDGTPEYSLHICGLRKLFPEALFIHIFRDVTSVVRSMLHFHHISGRRLVANEQEAYSYWLSTVRNCLLAERAYGPAVVHRLLYSHLIENPESAIGSLLNFVGEPYSARCLEPLAERINSSNVPPDFKADDPATDPAVVKEARRLSADMQNTTQPDGASPATAEELEAAFQQSCRKAMTNEQELKDQIANQQKHYLTEIEGYKVQIYTQQHCHDVEVQQYRTQLQNLQQHYLAEIEAYKLQIARQEKHYAAETEGYKVQLANQEQHYIAETDGYKAQLANQEQHYTGEIKRLANLLDQFANAATNLRSSRLWKLSNRTAVIVTKLFHRTYLSLDARLDKILARYSRWLAAHPGVANIENELEVGAPASPPDTNEQPGTHHSVEAIVPSELH
jgi:hypothetical protein